MKFPDISKCPRKNIDLMFIGLLDIIEGLCLILSLGYWSDVNFVMRYLCWRTEKEIENKQIDYD